ncbi:hypothetical protein [Aestuariivirga sp.]|uniref:hypothetical protein n=1 Tax=Aestuariivirga sp. TaxID=2650926 RepID=UPI003BAB6076
METVIWRWFESLSSAVFVNERFHSFRDFTSVARAAISRLRVVTSFLISSSTLRLVDFAAVALLLTTAGRLLAFPATDFPGGFLVAVADVARVIFEVFFLAFAFALAFAIASDIAERFWDERPFIPHPLRLNQECFFILSEARNQSGDSRRLRQMAFIHPKAKLRACS